MRSTAKIVSLRILKQDSLYVQVTIEYNDDPSRYYLSDGSRFENALVKMSDYVTRPDVYAVGSEVFYWFSSTVDRNSGKVRYFVSIEPVA